MSVQLVSIFVMFCAGVMIGAVIDAVRIILSNCSKKSILYKFSYVVEIIFWLLLGGATFYLLFLLKGGEWRFVDALAQLAGIFAYDAFFQPILRFIGRVFMNIVIKPLFFIVYSPIWFIIQMVRIVIRIIRPIGKKFKFFRKQL